MPVGVASGFTNVDPNGNPITPPLLNQMLNFGWEYVWHCHLLGHEENDMMRPLVLQVPHDPPAAPSGLTAVVTGTVLPPSALLGPPLKVNLSWVDNSTTEAGFRIERATVVVGVIGAYAAVATAGPWPGTGSTVTYADTSTTLAPGTTYAYRVFAFVNNPKTTPDSAPSNVVQVTTPTILAAPSVLKVAPSALSANPPTVALSWKDNSNNETGFQIQRARDVAFTIGLTTFLVGPNTQAFTDTTVAVKTTYYYRVSAFNFSGFSANTPSVTATTPGQLPGTPTGLAVTVPGAPAGRTSLILNWTAPASGGPVTGYTIQRSPNGKSQWSTLGTTAAVTYTNTGLTPNTTYYYRVQAYNADGTSGFTAVASGKTLP